MKVSDFVAGYVANLGPRVYTVCGAGSMHLNDSMCHHVGLKVIATHHEQAATFAAECESRITNEIGVICVTAGPGGSNAVTGIACAYVDSIPMLVIAGQVTSSTMAGRGRPNGMNELPMRQMVGPITKYAVTVKDPRRIAYELDRAVAEAMGGRRGPVWVEIPLDVQAADIDPERIERFLPIGHVPALEQDDIARCAHLLEVAERPVLIIGNGVRLAGAEDSLRRFLGCYPMPVVTSWSARDIIPDYPLLIGSCGIFGNRGANETVQQADVILALGTRLSYPQTGHHRQLFAPGARKIVVDIDHWEATKLEPDIAIVEDCKVVLDALFNCNIAWKEIRELRLHDIIQPYRHPAENGIDAYRFIEQLGEHLADGAIVITDVGFSFIPTMQTLRFKRGQRLIHSCGVSPMGWAIPASIGAAMAAPGRQIVCLTGDGGAMMNLQELQTIVHHNLPIKIFVYDNKGYETIKLMQQNHFGRECVSGPDSGLTCPRFAHIAEAFGIQHTSSTHEGLDFMLDKNNWRSRGPHIFELRMAERQVIAPRVQSKVENGKFVPTPIDHMWPPLAEAAE